MFGLTIFVYLQLLIEPAVVARFAGGSSSYDAAIAFLWDSMIGAIVGLPPFWYLGVAPLPALGAAATTGAVYGYLAGWVVCGSGVEVVTASVLGGGIGKPRKADLSQIEMLEVRGEYASARVEYQKLLDEDPTRLPVAIRQARLISGKLDEHAEAVALIRRTLAARKNASAEWAFALRILTGICGTHLGDERKALPDFARFLEAHPEGSDAQWAQERMAVIKESIE